MTVVQPPPPPVWTNQRLTLYHGTLDIYVKSILKGVNVNRGKLNTDFGRGFYTTTLLRQAESWARQLSQQHSGTKPAVIGFDVDRDHLAARESLWFVRGSFNADDFWSLVFHCRKGRKKHARKTNQGWYDVVIGPVAAFWRQRLIIGDVDQVSFHTNRAAKLLDNSNPKVIT